LFPGLAENRTKISAKILKTAPLCGAERNLVLSPEQRVDQHYQELVTGGTSGQWK